MSIFQEDVDTSRCQDHSLEIRVSRFGKSKGESGLRSRGSDLEIRELFW